MQEMIAVTNVKCGGCAKAIENKLLKTAGVHQVSVDIAQGIVTVEGDNLHKETLTQVLAAIGFPEKQPA